MAKVSYKTSGSTVFVRFEGNMIGFIYRSGNGWKGYFFGSTKPFFCVDRRALVKAMLKI